jgi:hypothetical protein
LRGGTGDECVRQQRKDEQPAGEADEPLA